jgi:hypothetical protein
MQNAPSTASANTIDSKTLDVAQELARKRAIEKAAEKEAAVRDIAVLEKQEFFILLTGAKGSDGASTNGSINALEEQVPDAIVMQVNLRTQEDGREIQEAVSATPDAHVYRRTDEMAAFQDDGDRSVGIGHDAFEDLEEARRRSKHEGEHRDQEKGDQVMELPTTGNPMIDRERGKLRRRVFREKGSMDAEGGASTDHTEEYQEMDQAADAVAEYVSSSGEDGTRLVQEAGETVQGFEKLHAAIVVATVRNNLRRQGALTLAA